MEDIGLEGLLQQYITNERNNLFTAMPAKIEKVVSLDEQRVDVQLLVDKITPDGETLKHPVILSVPLIFPGSMTSQFSFEVQRGDIVLCVFSQRSIQRFKLGANENHEPLDLSKYSRNDAVAVPGLFGFKHAVNNPSKRSLNHSVQDTVVAHNIGTGAECEVRLKKSGDVIINAPGNSVEVNCQDATINAESSSTVNTQTATISASSSTLIDSPTTTVTGDMLVQGTFTYTAGMIGSGSAGGATASITGSVDVSNDVTAGGVSLINHTHSGVKSGSSNTGTPN